MVGWGAGSESDARDLPIRADAVEDFETLGQVVCHVVSTGVQV